MGNTLRSHEDLIHIRGWTREQIISVCDSLRIRTNKYTLDKDEFSRYIGGRHREAITIFNDLDTDYDGKVDIFEVLVVLIVWSGTEWEAKQEILFRLFDMMNKQFLKVDEVMLMGTVLVQTMRKFVKLELQMERYSWLREIAEGAFTPEGKTKLTFDAFVQWSNDCEPFEQLRGFVEDHAARGQPDSAESRMRLQISTLEKHVGKLFERLERLQQRLPDFIDSCIEYVSAWGRRKRWDFVMQNLRQLILNLHQCAENMHTTLSDLSSSLKEDEATQGLSSVIEPHKRFSQEQMIIDVEVMRQQSLADFREATDLLRRLIEFTEPHETLNTTIGADQDPMSALNVINEEEHEQIMDMSPPRVVENRNLMKQVHNEMLNEIEEGGVFSRDTEGFQALVEQHQQQKQEALGDDTAVAKAPAQPAAAAGKAAAQSEDPPTLTAIANFDPPPSHQTQMLHLVVGDQVTVIGQDGRGWWYGRKQNGTEGWFPPSYVQASAAHYSSGGRS